jgi:hypothetical protein
MTTRLQRTALALVPVGLAAGALALSSGGGAAAVLADVPAASAAPTVSEVPAAPAVPAAAPAPVAADPDPGLASMSSPYVPGVWHVPASVLLAIGPDGPSYVGPEGSVFNGPTDEVDARVDAWWEARLAEGLTPVEADRLLARLNR